MTNMAAISAFLVKELRERTGVGMMECKKALIETDGDIEAAIEHMRKSGLAKAEKRAGRTAAEGVIAMSCADDGKAIALVEVNCETDFAAKNEDFRTFASRVSELVLAHDPENVEALLALRLDGQTSVDERRRDLFAKIGENIGVRRFVRYQTSDGALNAYLHGHRIGVVIELSGGDKDLAKDLAMHVAASNPGYISPAEVPEALVSKERDILLAQARDSGKPEEIIGKMVEGRLRKHLGEITLLGQAFVKDPDLSVEKLLKSHGAKVQRFQRLELGEGIERREESFADEVMAQVHGG
jgi:elongation factor Ts